MKAWRNTKGNGGKMKDVIERGLVFIGGFRSVQEISGRF